MATTTTTLAIPSGPVPLGHAATFSATIAVVAPGVGQPTGSVSFSDGSKLLGTSAVGSSGQAVFTTSTLGLGVHSITATYSGDAFDKTSGSTLVTLRIGEAVTGDYDGDGKDDLAIYDQTIATFYISYSKGGSRVQALGSARDVNVPVASDFDGDGKTDLAVYDQTAGVLFALESGGGTIDLAFGSAGDANIPLAGDFDGDGKSDIGIYDQTSGEFFILDSGGSSLVMLFGNKKHVNIPM